MEKTQFPTTFLLWLTFNRKVFLVMSEQVLTQEVQKSSDLHGINIFQKVAGKKITDNPSIHIQK